MPLKSNNPIVEIPERVYQRLIHNADRDETTGCLISRYSVGSHGYSQIGWREGGRARMTLGHRAVWIHERGPIPEDETVDHRQGKCHPKCIEIEHLRAIPNLDNARRNHGQDFPIGQLCVRNHGPEHQKLVKRTSKNGTPRWTPTCGECVRISRKKYADANPDKIRESQQKYNRKRRSA